MVPPKSWSWESYHRKCRHCRKLKISYLWFLFCHNFQNFLLFYFISFQLVLVHTWQCAASALLSPRPVRSVIHPLPNNSCAKRSPWEPPRKIPATISLHLMMLLIAPVFRSLQHFSSAPATLLRIILLKALLYIKHLNQMLRYCWSIPLL